MPFGFGPVKQGDRAYFDADPVASTAIPVNRNFCPVDAQLLRRLNRSPNIMSLMLVNYGSFFLEVWINRQDNLTYSYWEGLVY
jgi:hypothetical protein